jgi:hypothetical protein
MNNALTKFKGNLVRFMDEIIEQLPDEPDLVVARIFIKDQLSADKLMQYFVESILPLRSLVIARDERFFIENNVLFCQISGEKVNYFKRLWTDHLDGDSKITIWEWFAHFVRAAERYRDLQNAAVSAATTVG